jgi:hypothetical protein
VQIQVLFVRIATAQNELLSPADNIEIEAFVGFSPSVVIAVVGQRHTFIPKPGGQCPDRPPFPQWVGKLKLIGEDWKGAVSRDVFEPVEPNQLWSANEDVVEWVGTALRVRMCS